MDPRLTESSPSITQEEDATASSSVFKAPSQRSEAVLM